MNRQNCTMTENTVTFSESLTFDLTDTKGRSIGLFVIMARRTQVADTEGTWFVVPGTRYLVRAQKMVGGKTFGATPSCKSFETELAAMQYVGKVIDARKAAYTKQHGGEV